MSVTASDLIRRGAGILAGAGIEGAARDARLLLAASMGITADRLILCLHDPVSPGVADRFDAFVQRRAMREPMSHLLGVRAFFKHEFLVSPEVLDPRPETEALVLAALDDTFGSVLDLGTGSGAILLSLLAERRGARGVGSDLSAAALAVAARNAARLGLQDRVDFVLSDWFDGIEGRFDLIVSNPPYIALSEMADLAPELSHEPRMALTDEGDGLSAYRNLAAGADRHLAPGGRLMVEIGWQQGPSVAGIFEDARIGTVRILPDLDGRDRVVLVRKQAEISASRPQHGEKLR